ncbi:hypothetical protein G9A89_013017 [Geosiphon pyriformis]|nr:hypothetical protein G9A89_013017 [Geosiphon pyriformis]
MAYAPITKLDNFTGKEDDAQSLINKPQDFNAFKVEFLRYFSNNNSINRLVNTFTTMKQGETEAVTTYLGRFHQNLCQIQAIDANYFTAPQILNQFIRGLRSSILQHVCPLHSGTFQDAVTCARDFESAESEANHVQAINLVMNRSSELDSKLENLHNDTIIKKTLIVAKINHVHLHQPINSGNRKRVSATIVINKDIFKSTAASVSTLTSLCTNDAAINLSTTSISSLNLSTNSPNLSATATGNISTTTTNNLSTPNDSDPATKLTCQRSPKTENHTAKLKIVDGRSHQQNLGAGHPQNLNSQDYLSLLVTPKDASLSNQELTQKQQTLTSNISLATVTNNKSLAAIFPFEIKEPSSTPLFSGATLNEKLITAMYTDAKVDDQSIKLILDSGSAGTTCGHFKTPPREKLLIKLEEEKEKPTWEAYQVSWADADHNKLPPVLSWDNKRKRKEEEELTWRTNQESWSDDGQKEKEKGKEHKGEPKQTTSFTYIPYSTQPQNIYH